MRAALLAAALALVLAPAAAAQSGAPADTRTFDDVAAGPGQPYGDMTIDSASCPPEVEADPDPGTAGDQMVPTSCRFFDITLPGEMAQFSLNVWTADFNALVTAQDAARIVLTASDSDTEPPVATVDRTDVAEATWTPLTVADPGGAATIDSVTITTDHSELRIDDLTFAPEPQPDTLVTGGPSGTVASRSASFDLASTVTGSAFECSLDGGPFGPCGSPASYGGLADGAHSFRARAVDPYGNVDASPAARSWTVALPQQAPPDLGPDGDGVPDDRDNCPDDANAGQGDEDEDDVGDACEVFESGDIPPVAGLNTTVRAVSGEVFVRLPPGAGAARAFASQLPRGFVPLKGIFRSTAQTGEFVALKGIASIPVGSTIDARRGQVALTSAAQFPRPRDTRSGTQAGRFSAAIFTIRQRRRVRAATRGRRRARAARRPTTDLVLRTPRGRSRACASSRTRPPKGIVRALTGSVTGGTAKGTFRAVGKASITTVRRGTWITQDRCNGTLTEVGRGRATVYDREARTAVTVRAGQAYRARARLFAARRNRG